MKAKKLSIGLLTGMLLLSFASISQVNISSGYSFHIGPGTNISFSGSSIMLQDASKLTMDATSKVYFLAPITVNTGDINLAGDVEFTNGVSQTLSNFNMNVKNLTIGTNLTIGPNKRLTVNGILVNYGSNNGLVLESTALGTASLLHSTAGVEATVKRYIPNTNGENEFHMLSSPVAVQAISPNFNITDGFYLWSEPTSEWIEFANGSFTTANGGTNNFVSGRGYAVSYPTEVTKTFTGDLNQGTISFPLTVSPTGINKTWNYVGNPYPSAINWDASGYTRNTLENAAINETAIWVWNDVAQQYGVYINNSNTTLHNVTKNVAIGQGFWVKAATTGSFGMTNNVREHSSQAYLKSNNNTPNTLYATIVCETNNYNDELIITFGKTSDQGGAEKLISPNTNVPSLYSIKYNENWCINYLTNIDEHSIVPLGFKAGADANYKLTFTGVDNFTQVILEDLKTGVKKNLNANNVYQFTAQSSDNANRFLLRFKDATTIAEATTINPQIYYTNQKINIFNPFTEPTTVQVFDINGRLINTFNAKYGISDYNFDNPPAVYIIRLSNGNKDFTTKIVKW
ncbi:MAG: T9SS type A sorting domain-containing protein [Bacteroidales bacterium]